MQNRILIIKITKQAVGRLNMVSEKIEGLLGGQKVVSFTHIYALSLNKL